MKKVLYISLALVGIFLTLNSCGDGPPKYEVVISAQPVEGGTVSPDSGIYKTGTPLEITATPSKGWLFVRWKGDFSSTNISDTVVVKNDMHIIGVFEKKDYPLTIKTVGEGRVREQIIQAKSTTKYPYQTKVQLTAKPDRFWKFVKWKGGLTGSSNPTIVTVNGAKTITAVFEKKDSKYFYLADDGVTVKCTEAQLGSFGTVNGVTYKKRSKIMITPSNAATTCTSGITNMSGLFKGKTNFNADISTWDVSNVTDMSHMFDMRTEQQNRRRRDISNLVALSRTAAASTNSVFNQNISNWDVSSVTDMSYMFAGADAFNQPIGSWDVSSVTDMTFMFQKAKAFNKPIGSWNVNNVQNMFGMFNVAVSFNRPLNKWDVTSVHDMTGLFASAVSFNQSIDKWDVSNVQTMNLMFWNAGNFNQPIGSWDVSNVRSMNGMFKNAKSFNKPIGNWKVLYVTNMVKMFYKASSFNQDISEWCVARILTKPEKFAVGSPLTQAHMPNWGACNTQASNIIDMRLTQSTQNPQRTIPMATGRDAIVQIFFKTNSTSSGYLYDKQGSGKFNYDVTVTLYDNGIKAKQITIPAGTKTLFPVSTSRSIMNVFVAEKYIQPGLSVKMKTSNGWTFPRDGSRLSIVVQKVPELHIRFIPIHVPSRNNMTGDVNSKNMDEYMEAMLDMYPINNYKVDLHAPITVDSVSQDNLYSTALIQIQAVWKAEGKPDYYYYGVIPQDEGGTVGLGYIGGRQAVGWDYPGWQNRSATMAHELGHNFGRNHAPCGDVAGADPNYPYPDAKIGVDGYEVDKGEFKDAAVYHDLMSYCDPVWISDYTYKGVMEYRSNVTSSSAMIEQPAQDVVLLWGTITNGELELKPAFRMQAPASMPQKSGPYTLSGFGKNGAQLFSYSFSGQPVADLKGTRHFVFLIPADRIQINKLHTIQLSGRSLSSMQQASIPARKAQNRVSAAQEVGARRINANTVSIQWKSSKYKMALVKNARTGEILGFINESSTKIKTDAQALKVYFSDGVHTTEQRIDI